MRIWSAENTLSFVNGFSPPLASVAAMTDMPFVLEVMERALRMLLCEMEYRLPAQDLRIDRSRMPALPGSKIILEDIRRSERSLKET